MIEMPLIGPARLIAQLFGGLEEFDAFTQPLRRPGIVVKGDPGVESEPLFAAEGRRQSIGGCGDGHAIFSLSRTRRGRACGARAMAAAPDGIDSSSDAV